MLLKPVMEAFHGPKLDSVLGLFFFLLHPWSLGSCLASLVHPVFTPFPLKYKYYLGLKRELGGKLQYAPAPSFLSHRQGVFPGQQQPSESL